MTGPVRGNQYSLDIHTRTGTSSLVVAFGSLGAGLAPAGPLGILRLDQTSMLTLAIGNVANGAMTLVWTLPPNPAFAGMELHYQAFLVDPVNGPHLSNAIRDVVP